MDREKIPEHLPEIGVLLVDKAASFGSFREANCKLSRREKIQLQKYLRGNHRRSEIDGIIGKRTWGKLQQALRKANYHPEIWKAQLGELWQKVQKQGVLSLSKKQIALIQRDLAKKELLAIDGIAGRKTQRAIAHFIPKLANLKSAIQEAASPKKEDSLHSVPSQKGIGQESYEKREAHPEPHPYQTEENPPKASSNLAPGSEDAPLSEEEMQSLKGIHTRNIDLW